MTYSTLKDPYFEQRVSQIHTSELLLKRAKSFDNHRFGFGPVHITNGIVL